MVVIFKRMVVTTWFIGDRKAILPWLGSSTRPKAPGDPGESVAACRREPDFQEGFRGLRWGSAGWKDLAALEGSRL